MIWLGVNQLINLDNLVTLLLWMLELPEKGSWAEVDF